MIQVKLMQEDTIKESASTDLSSLEPWEFGIFCVTHSQARGKYLSTALKKPRSRI